MDNYSQSTPAYTKEKKPFPKKVVFLLILFLLLTVGGIAGVKYFTGEKNADNLVSPAASPTVTEAPTPTEVPATTPTPGVSGTPAPSSKVTPTKAAGKITQSDITVSILNGSGVAGAASKISATLKDLGYQIGTVGNADSYDYTDVSISVKKSKASVLTQLKKDLSSYTIGSTSATLKESDAADAVVIVGK